MARPKKTRRPKQQYYEEPSEEENNDNDDQPDQESEEQRKKKQDYRKYRYDYEHEHEHHHEHEEEPPRRKRRKKDEPKDEYDRDDDAGEDDYEKPRRKRSPRRKKPDYDDEYEDEPEEEYGEDEDDDDIYKPRKSRRRYPKEPEEEYEPDEDDDYGKGHPPPEYETEAHHPRWPYPSDPQVVLDAIQKKINRQTKKIDRLTDDRKDCQQEKDALTGHYDEIKEILKKYNSALDGLKQRRDDREIYKKDKTPVIEMLVEKIKDEIHRTIRGVDREIDKLARIVDRLFRKLEHAKHDLEEAKDNLDRKREHFNELKSRRETIIAHMATMETLKNEIELDEEERQYAVMYFKMKKHNHLLGETNHMLIPTERYKKLLYRAWFALARALDEMNDATDRKEEIQAEYDDKKAELELRQANRDAEIIQLLEEIEIPEYQQ